MTEGLKECRLCPRECGVDRAAGKLGYCRAGAKVRVYRYGPHFGEEPPLTGTNGSGAVFFSRCTLRCIYCQNHPWSQGDAGEEMEIPELTGVFKGLAERGCHNWNLVSPTPWLDFVQDAIKPLIKAGISLPIVYNTSGFEKIDTLEKYSNLADIALCDLRYSSSQSASEGSDAAGYVDTARQALGWFWDRLGELRCDDDGIARRGVICRLLVLPGRAAEAVANLEWLAKNIGTRIHVSVMSQYTPVHKAIGRGEWARKLYAEEYEYVTDAVDELGFDNGWVQPYDEEGASGDLLGQNMPAGEGAVGI